MGSKLHKGLLLLPFLLPPDRGAQEEQDEGARGGGTPSARRMSTKNLKDGAWAPTADGEWRTAMRSTIHTCRWGMAKNRSLCCSAWDLNCRSTKSLPSDGTWGLGTCLSRVVRPWAISTARLPNVRSSRSSMRPMAWPPIFWRYDALLRLMLRKSTQTRRLCWMLVRTAGARNW